MATRKDYEMLFALEAQLGREFKAAFAQARDELRTTADGAESFGDRATEAVDALTSAMTAAGVSVALGELKEIPSLEAPRLQRSTATGITTALPRTGA